MKDTSKEGGKKKGFLAVIWESMTMTGGCCGPGESCGPPSRSEAAKKESKQAPAAGRPAVANSGDSGDSGDSGA